MLSENHYHEGLACLSIVVRHYDKNFNEKSLSSLFSANENPSLMLISEAAEKIEFKTKVVEINYRQLKKDIPLPCILQLRKGHFVVFFKESAGTRIIKCVAPDGEIKYLESEFLQRWLSEGAETGSALLLEPSVKFKSKEKKINKFSWKWALQYFQKSRWQVTSVLISLFVTSLLQLAFPFLMQSIVDVGIKTKNIDFIIIILSAQLMLIFSSTIVDFVRSHLLLHISTVVNLSILSDFWTKLMRLPLVYFEEYKIGSILQQVSDNKQVHNFLTGPALNTFFSLLNFVVFAAALMLYEMKLFLVFSAGIAAYVLWLQFFLKYRRRINFEIFHTSSKENNITLQLVQGMREIRLQNIERSKRWEWEKVQTELFKLNFKNLSYGQFQQAGAILINQGKDVVLTFMVAKMVVSGELSLGVMLALQYIIGQLNGPVEQFITFFQSAQDAKISMERIGEIHRQEEEEDRRRAYLKTLPSQKTITLHNLSFSYPGRDCQPVLNNICLEIPEGKTTAIVGASGSGKTTILKLLLRFYEKYTGEIRIGTRNLKMFSPSFWRKQCGVVLQDGYLFDDTIAKNIAPKFGQPDYNCLVEACKTANILSFIESLPDKFDTRLGGNGIGVSEGQKQRLLIARAVYKDPSYLFFDESTNALDADNEKTIVKNLQSFFFSKTVVVVAHRLSTVKNADKIIVLDRGVIIEEGNHKRLSQIKGKYFELVKNQLELENGIY